MDWIGAMKLIYYSFVQIITLTFREVIFTGSLGLEIDENKEKDMR